MKIGPFDTDERVFIIAEAGVNHNGRVESAFELVLAAKQAGADAVKFQAFDAELFSEPQRNICRPLQLKHEDLLRLHSYCDDLGIMFLCTPFDREAVDFLDPLVPAFKIGSAQAHDWEFVRYVAGKGKPLIISTGAGRWCGVEGAAYLHCVSLYPTPPERADLMKLCEYGLDGYSDHTDGVAIPIAAVALGARIIEKHITLDRNQAGPDHRASIEPRAFAQMVAGVREVEAAMGAPI